MRYGKDKECQKAGREESDRGVQSHQSWDQFVFMAKSEDIHWMAGKGKKALWHPPREGKKAT